MRCNSRQITGYALVSLATICYGTAGVIGRIVSQYESNPLTIAMFQILLASILLFIGVLTQRRAYLRLRHARHLFVLAAYGFFGMFCAPVGFYYAIKFTTVTTATILFCSYPALVVILSAIFLHEPFNRVTTLALFLTIAGNALVMQCYHPQSIKLNVWGILFGAGTSVCMALFTLVGKRMVGGYQPGTIIFYGMMSGAVFLLSFRFAQGGIRLYYPAPFWLGILLLALLPALLADVCYLASLQYLAAGTVSIIASLQVVVAPVLAFFFLGEQPALCRRQNLLL